MLCRSEERPLVMRQSNGNDRRSAKMSLTPSGKDALLRLVSGAAQLQSVLLAPLTIEDRPHFMRCMKLIAEPGLEEAGSTESALLTLRLHLETTLTPVN